MSFNIHEKRDDLGGLTDRILTKSAQAGREVVEELIDEAEKRLKRNTPRSGMSLKTRQQIYRDPVKQRNRQAYYTRPLAQATYQSNVTGVGKLAPRQHVGYDKTDGWRAHFPDKGTMYQRRQDFTKKTIEEMETIEEKVINRKMEEVLHDST